MLCFCFFLHHAEKRLNSAIYRFLTRNGIDRYDPARFLDYKLEVLQMLLYCLPRFDPEQETEFLKYAKHYIQDGLLFCRMMVEAGSFASLAEYRHVRQIGAIYNNSAKTAQKSFPSLPSKADTRTKAYPRTSCRPLPSATTALPKARLLKSVVVPFEMERLDLI